MFEEMLSRRTLLNIGVGGASAAIAGGAQAQQQRNDPPNRAVGRPIPQGVGEPELPEDQKVGFAVVGLGKLALGEVLPAFGRCKRAKLVALVSGDRAKAGRIAAQEGLPADAIYGYADYDRIADDPRIDVVYIILPNALHAEYTIRALKAGKHVLCEKPMATSARDGEAMIAAARAADRRLMIAYRCHYEPLNLAAMRVMRKGELGRVRMVSTDNGRPSSLSDPADQWRLDAALSGNGALYDIGIYGINGARYLLNEEPVEVRAWTFTDRADPRFKETYDVIGWQMRMPSGAIVNGSTSFSYRSTSRLQVIGDEGRLELDPATSYRGLRGSVAGGDGERQLRGREIDQFAREMDYMAECVATGAPIVSTGEEGLQDVRIMEAILTSLDRDGAAVATDFGYRRAIDPAAVIDVPPASE